MSRELQHEHEAGGPPDRPRSLATFGVALRRQREALGLTQDMLAAKARISKPYLSNIETGRTPGPPSEGKLRAIAGALGWQPDTLVAAADWLRTPESIRRTIAGQDAHTPRRADGAIDLDQLLPPAGTIKPFAPPRGGGGVDDTALPVRQVPMINRVAAGKAAEYTDLDYPAGVADDYVPAPDLPEAPVRHAFALRVTGDSMAPDYAPGDIIIVGPGEARDGDDCVVRLTDEASFATTFKRLFFLREGTDPATPPRAVRLVPLNPSHSERVVAMEAVSGIYPLMYRLVPPRREVKKTEGCGGQSRR